MARVGDLSTLDERLENAANFFLGGVLLVFWFFGVFGDFQGKFPTLTAIAIRGRKTGE